MGCFKSNPITNQRQRKFYDENKRTFNRLSTKFQINQVEKISKQKRLNGIQSCYVCPICFIHYNKILVCNECNNFVCHHCFDNYWGKSEENKKCAFCASLKSLFIDYELQPRQYFDSQKSESSSVVVQELKAQEKGKKTKEAYKQKERQKKTQPSFQYIEQN